MELAVVAAAGLALGLAGRGLWGRAAEAAMGTSALVLVFLMGAELSRALPSPGSLWAGAAIAAVPGALSVALARAALARLESGTAGGGRATRRPRGLAYVSSLAVGILVGAFAHLDGGPLVDPLLYLLVFTASYTVGGTAARSWASMRMGLRAGALLSIAVLSGGALGGLLVALALGLDAEAMALAGIASGWYSLVGPLLLPHDPGLAASALLGNMAREALHISLYPYLSRRIPLSAIALGGATTMDTGLPVVTACAGEQERAAAFVQGIATTLALSVILPAVAAALP